MIFYWSLNIITISTRGHWTSVIVVVLTCMVGIMKLQNIIFLIWRSRSHTHRGSCSGESLRLQIPRCVHQDDLTWSRQADSAVKTAQKQLCFLRRLKKFGMSAKTLRNFYRCTIESILSGCITARYGSCSAADRRPCRGWWRQRSVSSAAISLQCKASTTQHHNIIKDHSHPGYGLLTLLPSGRRYRSIRARTTRLTNSFFPQALRLLKQQHWPTEQSPSPCTFCSPIICYMFFILSCPSTA